MAIVALYIFVYLRINVGESWSEKYISATKLEKVGKPKRPAKLGRLGRLGKLERGLSVTPPS